MRLHWQKHTRVYKHSKLPLRCRPYFYIYLSTHISYESSYLVTLLTGSGCEETKTLPWGFLFHQGWDQTHFFYILGAKKKKKMMRGESEVKDVPFWQWVRFAWNVSYCSWSVIPQPYSFSVQILVCTSQTCFRKMSDFSPGIVKSPSISSCPPVCLKSAVCSVWLS